MNTVLHKQKQVIVPFTSLLLAWLTLQPAYAINIKVGDGEPLETPKLQVVHQETFDSNKPHNSIFWGALGVGNQTKPPWVGQLTKDLYTLTNSQKPNVVRYYYRERLDATTPLTLSEYGLSVEINGTMSEQLSGAGLLYAFNPATKHYLAFVKGTGKTYAIYQKNNDGLRKVMGGGSEAINKYENNTLSIFPMGSTINFYINSKHIAAIHNGTAPTGAAGILAISSGMFLFDNFTLYSSQIAQNPNQNKEPVQSEKVAKELPQPLQVNNKTETPKTTQHTAEIAEKKKINSISYKAFLKPGLDKEQVIETLGKPAYMRGPHLFYNLDHKGEKETTTLVVQFDEKDKVLGHQTIVQ